MFSTRFHWDLRPNRLTRELESRRRQGQSIFDLTESNPTRAGFEYPEGIVRAFEDPGVLRYNPAPAGLRTAREAVVQYYADRGTSIDVERVLLTASTSEAYAYLFKLLADPGDHVLVPCPSYPLFEFLAGMESIGVRHYSLTYQGEWAIDWNSLAGAVDARTKAIVLVNPNNPTGSYLKHAELEALAVLCAERGVALISDEVFADYAFSTDPQRVPTLAGFDRCLSFSMSGLSKIAGLPQMKLGWIVVNGPAGKCEEAFERLEWIADTYLSVSTPVQCAAARLLGEGAKVQAQIRERTAANLAFAVEALAGSAADILQVEGGWYITLQVPRVRTEEEWAIELLNRAGVLVQPGFFFDFEREAFLVVSLLTLPEIFREGIARLRKLLESSC